MSILVGLEEKVQALVLLSTRLKEEHKKVQEENQALLQEIKLLKTDNASLVDEVIRLEAHLKTLENSLEEETKSISVLYQEKNATKLAVDDLIKSINILVESECQQ